jgi:hypothetical protein
VSIVFSDFAHTGRPWNRSSKNSSTARWILAPFFLGLSLALLALALIFALPVPASAAETTEARVPVTLTVVNTVSPISCTVPAALPVSLVDGYVVCANNAAITNTGKTGAIRVTKVDVQAGTFEIGNFDDFTASKNSIALSINGCSTKGAGSLTLVGGAFPAIAAEKNLAIRYKAKVSASEAVTNINAATIVFTIAAVNEKEAA